MFFNFLLFLSFSVQTFYQLTGSTFKRLVENRKKNEVWFVMFSGNYCPACQQAYPYFVEASKIAGGMVKFGKIEITTNAYLAEKFDLRTIPRFRVFHKDGDVEYFGDRAPKSFVNFASNYIQDYSTEVFDESWKESRMSDPGVIFFTDKSKSPALWKGLTSYFYGKPIRFGASHGNKTLQQLFNVENVPEFYFFNGTHDKHIKPRSNFTELKDIIDDFFGKRLSNDVPNDENKDFYSPSQFNDICLGSRQTCIIIADKSEKPSDLVLRLIKMNARHKFRWFVGDNDLPYGFIKKGSAWIYNPRRDGFYHVDNIEELPSAIDHVLDGGAKWTKRMELTNDSKEL